MAPTPKPGILSIEPYKPGLSKAGNIKKVTKLSSNETPLGASPLAIKAFKKAAAKLHRYPDGSASALRQAIGQVYGLNPNQIVCGSGSDELIAFICAAYATTGDEVLYSEHGFLMYDIYARIAGAMPVKAHEKDLHTNVDALLAAVTEKTKIVFIANPNNPTGSYVDRDEILRLRQGLPAHVLLVLDSAYAEYVSKRDYTSGADIVDLGENTIMTCTFSKIYGLAALRVGWGYFPESIADIINRVRGPFNVSIPAQEAAIAAVQDQDFIKLAKKHNDVWLPWLSTELKKLGLIVHPSVANFILVEFPGGAAQADAANQYMMSKGVIVRAVGNYGLAHCLRVTIGLEADNQKVVQLLTSFLKK